MAVSVYPSRDALVKASRGAVFTGFDVPRSLGWISYHLQSDSIPCQKRLGRIVHLTCEKEGKQTFSSKVCS